MPTFPFVLIDGREPTTSTMLPFALINDGHFTAMQVRDRAVRGVQLHLDRLVSAHRTLFGTELDAPTLRSMLGLAVTDHPDCYLRVTTTEPTPQPSECDDRRPTTERSADACLVAAADPLF